MDRRTDMTRETQLEDQDDKSENPSEAELLQVKCLRLENKVKTLKDVSSIRKNLLDLRERESKDLIKKLQSFEVAVQTEKEKRERLTCRMEEADAEYRQLAQKLAENVTALNQAKTLYEKRVRVLATQLDEAGGSLQIAAQEKEELEKRLLDESIRHEIQLKEMEDNLKIGKDREHENGNKKLEQSQRELNEKLFKVLEENELLKEKLSENEANRILSDQEKELLLQSLQNLEQELKESRVRIESLSNRIPVQNPAEENPEGLKLEQQKSKTSIMVDVNRILEKLEEAEQEEFIQVEGPENCYKSVETSGGGSELVISVSGTFIKLKDLIVEKKGLQNEIHGLKQLTKKLETKVDKESRRLYLVSLELNKTWRLVAKLKAQHGQLHTSKSVQRYELQEKRRFLETLKRDLGASRAKWVKVREKNLASQIEWESIRDEFARRRREDPMSSQSRESAFFEESSSSANTSIEEEEASVSGDYLEEEEVDMEGPPGGIEGSSEIKVKAQVEDSVEDLAGDEEIEEDSIVDGVEESQDDEIVVDDVNLTYEELINRRAHRLLELEEQCHLLSSKLRLSKDRNTELAAKLANLHSHYGYSENGTTSSEDSAMEGDEIGLLTETSGDTAYMSHGGDAESHTMEETELPFDNEVDDTGEISPDAIGLVEISPVFEAPSLELREQVVEASHPSSSSSNNKGNRNQSVEKQESFVADQISGKNITINSEIFLGDGERVGDEDIVGFEEEKDVRMTSLTPQPLTDNYSSCNPDSDDMVEEFHPLTTTTTTMTTGKGNEADEGSNPSDVSKLSRIIIQQLPKLLDVLKNENAWLKSQVSEAEKGMKASRIELEEQKDLISRLRPRIEASLTTEMELRTELDLKQRLIQELTTKIQIATDNYEAINEEHSRMGEYVKMKLQETQIQEQRKLVKMRNIKNCVTCTKKFTLFKRKVHCSNCGHSFCGECLIQQSFHPLSTSNIEREPRKKVLFCTSCDERKRKLEDIIQPNLYKMQKM